jgi:hypothetical protein
MHLSTYVRTYVHHQLHWKDRYEITYSNCDCHSEPLGCVYRRGVFYPLQSRSCSVAPNASLLSMPLPTILSGCDRWTCQYIYMSSLPLAHCTCSMMSSLRNTTHVFLRPVCHRLKPALLIIYTYLLLDHLLNAVS